MIQNDQELHVTRERVSYLLDLLVRLRKGCRPEELATVTSGYRSEVERMQREMLDFLTQPEATIIVAVTPEETIAHAAADDS